MGGGNGVFIVDRKTLEIVGNVQPAGIIGAGHQIADRFEGQSLYRADHRRNAEVDVQGDAGGRALEPIS